MKPKLHFGIVFLLIISGCMHEPTVVPAIELTGSSTCKSSMLKAGEGTTSGQDCIHYRWVEGDTLIITHINAAFNCCPQGFTVTMKVSGDTIAITEKENSALCDCSCLFDLDSRISGIGRAKWRITVIEQYVQPSEEALSFDIDLEKSTTGEFCVTRTGYPWGLQ